MLWLRSHWISRVPTATRRIGKDLPLPTFADPCFTGFAATSVSAPAVPHEPIGSFVFPAQPIEGVLVQVESDGLHLWPPIFLELMQEAHVLLITGRRTRAGARGMKRAHDPVLVTGVEIPLPIGVRLRNHALQRTSKKLVRQPRLSWPTESDRGPPWTDLDVVLGWLGGP